MDLVDLVLVARDTVDTLMDIIDDMSKLGLNWLQLRFMNDFGFVIEFPEATGLFFGDGQPLNPDDLALLAVHAKAAGVHIIPEISVATRAGGWFGAGGIMHCPNHMCKKGVGIVGNVTVPHLLTSVYGVAQSLFEVFQPPYIHLGYDEREEALDCLLETNTTVDFGLFEDKVTTLFEMQGFPMDRVVRWENREGVEYGRRAGELLQYQYTIPNKNNTEGVKDSIDPKKTLISTGFMLGEGNATFAPVDYFDGITDHARTLVATHPLAVIAPVHVHDGSFWKRKSFKEELAALAAGLTDPDSTAVTRDGMVGLLQWNTTHPEHNRSFVDFQDQQILNTCQDRTTIRYKIRLRPGAFE